VRAFKGFASPERGLNKALAAVFLGIAPFLFIPASGSFRAAMPPG